MLAALRVDLGFACFRHGWPARVRVHGRVAMIRVELLSTKGCASSAPSLQTRWTGLGRTGVLVVGVDLSGDVRMFKGLAVGVAVTVGRRRELAGEQALHVKYRLVGCLALSTVCT